MRLTENELRETIRKIILESKALPFGQEEAIDEIIAILTKYKDHPRADSVLVSMADAGQSSYRLGHRKLSNLQKMSIAEMEEIVHSHFNEELDGGDRNVASRVRDALVKNGWSLQADAEAQAYDGSTATETAMERFKRLNRETRAKEKEERRLKRLQGIKTGRY